MGKRQAAANRVFVGYQWRTYKGIWEKILSDLHKKSPLHFMAIGREPGQPAAQLLSNILGALDRSSAAFFDASGGNANVSLEYGYARSIMAENSLYLFMDEDSSASSSPGSPIISDLAGTVANRYQIGDGRLEKTIEAVAENHVYVKRFKRFCRQRSYRGGTIKFLIRMIRQLDGKTSILRRELLDDVVHDARKKETYVDKHLKELHKAGLLTVSRGNEYSSRVSVAG
jgi:hypothetical protein